MKTIVIFVFMLGLFSMNGFGQVKTDAFRQLEDFYRNSLDVDTLTAQKVTQIMQKYKLNVAAIESDTTLSLDVRREQYKKLAATKDRQLMNILNPVQQRLMIHNNEADSFLIYNDNVKGVLSPDLKK